MLPGDNWPGNKSDVFLDDSLNPGLDERVLSSDSIDGGGWSGLVVQVGLVEHECIMVEPEQVAVVGC